MVSMIPEQEIYLGAFASIESDAVNTAVGKRIITLNSTFVANFSLMTNLYKGCVLEIYAVSGNAFIDKTVVISNAANTITVSNTLDTAITGTASNYYGVLRQFGSPVPAPLGSSTGSAYTPQVLSIQFKSDTRGDYEDVGIIFGTISAVGGTQEDVGIFLTTDGSYGDAASLTGQTEYDIVVTLNSELTTAEEIIDAVISACNSFASIEFSATRVGDSLILTNTYGGPITRVAGCDDGGADSAIDNLDIKALATIELSITTVGATSTVNNVRLLSDTWIGLVDSVTVPTTSVEMKQLNLAASGTRNYVYQFKGAEATGDGNFSLFANNFSWLYYVLGKQTFSVAGERALDTALDPANAFNLTDNDNGAEFIHDTVNDSVAGSARFYRIINGKICPPIRIGIDAVNNTFKKTSATATDLITYTYTEANGEDLPSFALEYTLKKGSSLATVATDSDSESIYTKIYPGCQVDSMTIDATEGQEIKSTVNFKAKTTIVAPANYDTFNGQTNIENFTNYGNRKGGASLVDSGLMTPYFFSDGSIQMFGQEYIRIQSCTLTISNALQDKRYIGRYDKTIKSHIPTQRTYELSFTGHVVDDQIFEQLRNESAYALVGNTSSDIILSFYKANGEETVLRFNNYMIKTGDFPLTNDKGPLTISWTVEPLRLQSAVSQSYWVNQG